MFRVISFGEWYLESEGVTSGRWIKSECEEFVEFKCYVTMDDVEAGNKVGDQAPVFKRL